MAETNGFQTELRSALQNYQTYLEEKELPKVKEAVRIYHTSFQSIYNVLLRKGLIAEDPYRGDHKVSEVAAPPKQQILDSERETKLSVRLAEFDAQLDFLANYFQFSLEFVTLKRIKKVVDLVTYVRWDQFNTASTDQFTRILAEVTQKIRSGNDQMSTSIVADSEKTLAENTKRIVEGLKKISIYKREEYKLQVRETILPSVDIENASSSKEATNAIKAAFKGSSSGLPYYSELVSEVVSEESGPDSADSRESTLKRLSAPSSAEKKPRETVALHSTLLEAVRTLANSSRSLEEAARKLSESAAVLEGRKRSVGERFKEWIQRLTNKEARRRLYEIELSDIATATMKRETLDFDSLLEAVRKKARLFGSIMSKTSPAWKKLENAGEDQLLAFISKNLEELQRHHRRLEGLDTYFKTEANKEERDKLRGIKIELAAIKNHIVTANQKRHEYVARREEVDQMRKLGVDVDVS